MRPLAHLPRHPLALARFGPAAAAPVSLLARSLPTPQARALFGGTAAHSFSPFSRPFSAAAGHGADLRLPPQRLAGRPRRLAGRSPTRSPLSCASTAAGSRPAGRCARWRSCRPPTRCSSTSPPRAVVELAGDRLPRRVARAYRRYKHGPGAFKVDLAVEGGVPWTDEASRPGGDRARDRLLRGDRRAPSARSTAAGCRSGPFVLVGQQYLADPSRSRGDVHPVWAYAHVPHGYAGDATEALLDQIERFAPGLRERIVARHIRSPAEFESYNPNYVGGDIITGANTPLQSVFRPRLALDPYATGIPGVFICSAATPPGAGRPRDERLQRRPVGPPPPLSRPSPAVL